MRTFQLALSVAIILSSVAFLPQAYAVPPSRDSSRYAGITMHPLYQVLTTNLTTPRGFFPSQIRHAYGFDQLSCSFTKPWGSPALCGSGQTIAIVDAFDDPVIESDLAAFDNQFGIPACSTANGCFTKATPEGQPNPSNAGNDGNHDWAREMDVDVEWAHAIAPGAKILLVETLDNSNGNLFPGVDYAASRPGVSQVSLSWGGAETGGKTSNGQLELSFDIHFKTPGVSFLVASGDNGGENEWYPAASPWVIGVGGTNLTLDGSGNVLKETAWSGSGGGISPYEPEPSYQVAYGISSGGFRSVPDVSYLGAGPYAVYDGFGAIGATGWFTGGGTSFGAPQWAALLAIVNSGRTSPLSSASFGSEKVVYNAATGSAYSLNFRDVIVGSNGKCGAICTAGPGYDFVTGLGSPLANNLVPFLRHS